MSDNIKTAINQFLPEWSIDHIDTVKNGNINDTYTLYASCDNMTKPFTLQRINGYVFKSPEQIMSNISRVTQHLKRKIEETGRDSDNHVICPLTALSGKPFFSDGSGSFWRMYPYITHSVCYNEVRDADVMTMIGRAFGEFQMHLSDFPAETLNITIPDFHNTKKRYNQLYTAAEADVCGRADEVRNELDYLGSIERVSTRIDDLVEGGLMKLRVTHNDTKANNVLLDADTNEPLTVIDLDTVMPGLAVHDFGDAVRYGANKVAEDEADLRSVGVDLNIYEAFAKGFIPPIRDALTKLEIENMALGAVTMASELATRFLADYLSGDKYFKIGYDKHNLVRARCQIALANDMLVKYDKMCAVVEKYA
ncbi:MAG TPA: aminoglycoside phosphotransferase family protein [Bacillota bacterium]|nr:aminoglycoside phosphotransferase family protein [Bacillota bacterium]